MKRQFEKLTPTLLLLLTCCLLWGCEQPKATVSDLSKPLSNSPAPTVTPTIAVDPQRTDLNRVVMGTVAPDFALEDMNKKIVRLSDYRGKQYVILVFYRGHF